MPPEPAVGGVALKLAPMALAQARKLLAKNEVRRLLKELGKRIESDPRLVGQHGRKLAAEPIVGNGPVGGMFDPKAGLTADPMFLAFVAHFLETGSESSLEALRAHIPEVMVGGPTEASVDAAVVAGIVVETLERHAWRAKADDRAAVNFEAARIRDRIEQLGTEVATRLSAADEDALAQLRRASATAAADAVYLGEVPDELGALGPARLDRGLYVEREIEGAVLETARNGAGVCAVVVGTAGAGKTSLLWHLSHILGADDEFEVCLLKSSSYMGATTLAGYVGPLLDPERTLGAVRAAQRQGRRVVLLIDTVDVLLHSGSGRDLVLELFGGVLETGAVIVASCRGEEAPWLRPVRTHNFGLESYSDAELDVAIIGHVSRYYARASDRNACDELARLLGLVAQRHAVGELLRHPLLMRMVFELYAPHQVPGELHTFRLYTEYWNRRVRGDRRSESEPPMPAGDLSRATATVAGLMLAEGLPEVRGAALAGHAGAAVSAAEIDALVDRGVLIRSELGTLSFFHQTFFEHAAGRLFAGSRDGLARLEGRLAEQPHDLFLAPIREQALLAANTP